MNKLLESPESQTDVAGIGLELFLDLSDCVELLNKIAERCRKRIERKISEGVGQTFEEGNVFLQADRIREGNEFHTNSVVYQMDFGQSGGLCPRMHIHPYGERYELIFPNSNFQVWSATAFSNSHELQPLHKPLASVCKETKRKL